MNDIEFMNAHSPEAKQRLLLAAEEIFAEWGFAGASVRDICNRANTNVAAINYYFGGGGAKERLYIEAVKNAHLCSMSGHDFPEFPADMPPEHKLRLFIREMVRRMYRPARPSAMALTMREMANPSTAAGEVVREYIRPIAFKLLDIVKEICPNLPDERHLMIGFSVIGQILYYRQNAPVSELIFGHERISKLSEDGVMEHITQFTLTALGYDPNLSERVGT
jgi:TetR/AcrR family transcriptional regulator, regulator of cefoperazone and chloramphenicol sensitivity